VLPSMLVNVVNRCLQISEGKLFIYYSDVRTTYIAAVHPRGEKYVSLYFLYMVYVPGSAPRSPALD